MRCKAIKRYVILHFLFSITTLAYADLSDNSTTNNSSGNFFFNDIFFFPQVGIQIEGKSFSENTPRYRMETDRIFDIEIIRINKFSFSMLINETLIFYDKSSGRITPRLINYEMDYGNIGWDFKYGRLSCFFDHYCSNVINENKTERRQIRWYGYGVRWETYGIKPGRKNTNIYNISNDNFLIKNLNYRISAARKIYTKEFNYNYLVTCTLRYDIISNNFIIPYFEGSFTSFIYEHMRHNRYFETGIRMRFNNGDLTPFIGYNHKYDIEYYNYRQIDLFYIGLRMETLLNDPVKSSQAKHDYGSLFPDFHFSGSYGKYIFNDKLNFNTDILITMDFINRYNISPIFTYRLMHNSLAQSSGMFPRYIQQNIEAGILYKTDIFNVFVEPYCSYSRFDEGNYYNGYSERFLSGGLRLSSLEMKTGYANTGISFDKTSNHQWINRIDWETSIERTFKKHYNMYTWEYNLKFKYNIYRIYIIIPYITSGISLNKGNEFNKIFFVEPGIRILNGLYWMLFYKYENRSKTDAENGLYKHYHLIGIRLEI